MHDFQTEIFALDFSRYLTPLLAVHFVPVIWCWGGSSLSCCSPLASVSCSSFHTEFNSARPGRRPLHSLSIGVGPLFFSDQRRHHLYNRQYRSHAPFAGRNAPETLCGLSCRASLCLRF
jgi:hypothetical protein